jgi:hypothetical protein
MKEKSEVMFSIIFDDFDQFMMAEKAHRSSTMTERHPDIFKM